MGKTKYINESLLKSQRLGQVGYNKKNEKMIIIYYKNSHNISVQFEDGTIVKYKYYESFLTGAIANPNYYKHRIGETNINNQGFEMTIIRWENSKDIDVQFNDNTIVENVRYDTFKNGEIAKPICRIGETSINNQGLNMTIIEYYRHNNITVQFEDGTIVKYKTYWNFKEGKISNPNYNIKFINENRIKEYLSKKNINFTHDTHYFRVLRSNKNAMLRPDFILSDYKYWIEYDGEGHFLPINFSGEGCEKSIEKLKRNKENDEIKNKFSFKKGFALIRIPYTHKEFINQILDDMFNMSDKITFYNAPLITIKILSKYKPIDELILKTWKETKYIE